MVELKDFCIKSSESILSAFKKVDINCQGILFVVENGIFYGSLTDGDLRRALIAGADKGDCIKDFCNEGATYRHFTTPENEIRSLFNNDIRVVPLVDDNKKIVDIATVKRPHHVVLMEPRLYGNELNYITDCLKTNWISSQGSYVTHFEKKLAKIFDMNHCLAVSNGTVALHLALESLNIGAGDEVITTNLTFGATVNSIIHSGAKPVLVDVDKNTWNIDPTLIEAAITSKTKAIMPVHLYGNPCDMTEIMAIAAKHNIFVIEDCAESLGAMVGTRPTGSFGDLSTVSFFANKVVTTGEGGALQVNNKAVYLKAKQLRDHGMQPDQRYWHDVVGYNYRLTNIQAAIGCAQLEQLEDFTKKRIERFQLYHDLFEGCEHIQEQHICSGNISANWLYTICLKGDFSDKRDQLISYLKLKGIETRPIFYPMNEMPAFKNYVDPGEFPISRSVSYSGISLPSSLSMTIEESKAVVDNVLRFFTL